MSREVLLDAHMASAKALTTVGQRLMNRVGVAGILKDNRWHLQIVNRPGVDPDDAVCDVLGYLADEMLREQLDRETAPVRALVMAQVFSKVNLVFPKHEGLPPDGIL